MGLASARQLAAQGAEVILVSRSAANLAAAAASIRAAVPSAVLTVAPLDCQSHNEAGVRAFFAGLAPRRIDVLVVTPGASAGAGGFASDTFATVRLQFEQKFFLQWLVAHAALPVLSPTASVTFFSGALARRPGKNSSALAAANAAVETLTIALANDLAPIRVNCVSPGLTRTNAIAPNAPADVRDGIFNGFGKVVPAGRAGEADDLGHAVVFLATNNWTTGVVLPVDGGALVRE